MSISGKPPSSLVQSFGNHVPFCRCALSAPTVDYPNTRGITGDPDSGFQGGGDASHGVTWSSALRSVREGVAQCGLILGPSPQE